MGELEKVGNRLLVVFDGNCGLCNGWVRWLLRRDRHDRLRFAASSSSLVADLLAQHSQLLPPGQIPGTVLVFRDPCRPNQKVWSRFAAVRIVLNELPGPWPALSRVLGGIPGFLSDPAYRLVARWRYRIWGRLDHCPIPTPEQRERFVGITVAPPESC
jgi:predicted DCC family thiol-disulfide oxidoreductase YuxK